MLTLKGQSKFFLFFKIEKKVRDGDRDTMIGIKKSAEPVFKWLSQQEEDLRSIVAMPAPAPGNPDQLIKIRNHVKELQDPLSMIMIRIIDGEEVYNKFLKGSGGNIPGLSAEHEKLRAVYKKEKEEDLKMKEKEKKEILRNQNSGRRDNGIRIRIQLLSQTYLT